MRLWSWSAPLLLLTACPGDDDDSSGDDDAATDDDDAVGDDDDYQPLPGSSVPLPPKGASFAEAPVRLPGPAGQTARVGQAVAICDLDDDGRMDLLISAPRFDGNAGIVGVWSGAQSASWGAELAFSTATWRFPGDPGSRLGYGAACGDVDGDGRTDLVTATPRWFGPQDDVPYSLVVYHQPSGGWAASNPASAAGRRSSDLGIASTGFVAETWMELKVGDLDRDGAAEIVLSDRRADLTVPAVDKLLVLPGQRTTGDGDLLAAAGATLTPGVPTGLRGGALAIGNVDGRGGSELIVGEPFDGPGMTHYGKVSLLSRPDGSGAIEDAAYASVVEDGEARAFGVTAVILDADGDGRRDLALGGIEENIEGPEPHGGVWVYADVAAVTGEIDVDDGDGHVAGDPEAGFLGMQMARARDRDGDGGDELVVYQPDLLDMPGTVWVLAGGALDGTLHPAEGALTWLHSPARGELDDRLAVGDLDGDGADDFVLGTPSMQGRLERPFLDSGAAWIWLSGGAPVAPPAATDWRALSIWFLRAMSPGPVLQGTLDVGDGPVAWTDGEAVAQVSADAALDARVTADGFIPHRLVGHLGALDAFVALPLFPSDAWATLLGGAGVTPDPTRGHVLVAVAKRDGAGAWGTPVALDPSGGTSLIASGQTALVAGDVVPNGPGDLAFVLFPNVPVGVATPSVTLDDGETCFPAPGGVKGTAIPPVPVEPGVLTVLQLRCGLNRF